MKADRARLIRTPSIINTGLTQTGKNKTNDCSNRCVYLPLLVSRGAVWEDRPFGRSCSQTEMIHAGNLRSSFFAPTWPRCTESASRVLGSLHHDYFFYYYYF